MTATDELRRMLDERGVEYETYVEQPTGFEHVKWNFNEHGSADFNIEFGEPWLTMYGTISGPEQAIEATLGRGECRDKGDGTVAFKCSECGCWVAYDEDWSTGLYAWVDDKMKSIFPHYCPNCGRKVTE